MLFTYKPIDHPLHRLQEYIDYLFLEVWCKAADAEYDITLFDGCFELKEIINDFSNLETKAAKFFNGNIQKIYKLFTQLDQAEIDQLKIWYHANNKIDALCSLVADYQPIRYNELIDWNADIGNAFKAFFPKMYDADFLTSAPIKNRLGDMSEHYRDFVKLNDEGKCPYCGIADIEGGYSSKREAYDHFLPKGIYPFNSINFYNLAPMCHKCNCSYKLSKDPLLDNQGARL